MHDEDLLLDPLTQREREELRWYLGEYWRWPYEQFAVRGQEVEKLLVTIGKRLYERVFGTAGAQMVIQPWNLQPDADRQITIESALPSALSIPWELLHDDRGFLALRGRHPVSIIRRLPQRQRGALTAPFQPPLRILLITARPDDAGFVDPRGIAGELLDEVEKEVMAGEIDLEFLRPPTMPALRQRLIDTSRPPIHLVHFDGHGAFHQAPQQQDGLILAGGAQGMLAFETEEGKLDLVSADDLANVLQDSGVRLAVLTACESALGAEVEDPDDLRVEFWPDSESLEEFAATIRKWRRDGG